MTDVEWTNSGERTSARSFVASLWTRNNDVYLTMLNCQLNAAAFTAADCCLDWSRRAVSAALFPDFLELWADSVLCSAVAADGCLEGQSAFLDFLELWAGLL